MSDTTKISSSVSTADAAIQVEMVPVTNLPAEAVITHQDEDHFSGVAVRVNKAQVVLRFEPKALEDQRRTEMLNERIRKYGKAY